MNCGMGASSAGWRRAGFETEWSVERDPVARRICRHNDLPCRSAEPSNYRPVDFAVYYCGSNWIRVVNSLDAVRIERPPAFLIESDSRVRSAPEGYDVAFFSLNASRYFVPHARIKEYCFGIRKDRNPGGREALGRFLASVKRCNETPMPLFEVIKSEAHLILPPKSEAGRGVHSHLRPLPEVHAGGGEALRDYQPHECDSADVSQARLIGTAEIASICGVSHIRKPDDVDRVSWFKWVGQAMDPELSQFIGVAVMRLLESGVCASRRKCVVLGEQPMPRRSKRTSKFEYLIRGGETLEQSCSALGVTLEAAPAKLATYKQGSGTAQADSIFSSLAGLRLPTGAVSVIKERANRKSKPEDLIWFLDNKRFTSKRELKEHLASS